MASEMEDIQVQIAKIQMEIAKTECGNASKDVQIAELKKGLTSASPNDIKLDLIDDKGTEELIISIKEELQQQRAVTNDLKTMVEQDKAGSDWLIQDRAITMDIMGAQDDVTAYKAKYEKLLSQIGRLETRMVKLVSDRSLGDDLGQSSSHIVEAEEYLSSVLSAAEKYKQECMELQEDTQLLEAEVTRKQAELKLARAKMEYVTDVELRAKKERLQQYTVDMESELGARERILEAQKNFMTVSIMEEQKLAGELELFKARLESVRAEFKDYKIRTASHIAELQGLLVQAQDELGEIKGSTHMRERVVQTAQERLKTLTPYVGIEILSGLSNRVRVVGLREGGPADLAGLKKNDIIEMANGEYTRTNEHFRNMIAKVRAGDTISFQVLRSMRMVICSVCISAREREMSFDGVINLRRIAGGIVRDGDHTFLESVIPGKLG